MSLSTSTTMYYEHTSCPNCHYPVRRQPSPRVPLKLDWTQWQDITWYDNQGRPLTYPKYQTWFDDGLYIYRIILTGEIMRGKHETNLYIGKAPISENTDAYTNGMWKPTPHLIRYLKSAASYEWETDKPILDRIFGYRQAWETIITEFTECCTQLTQNGISKSYSEQLAQSGM